MLVFLSSDLKSALCVAAGAARVASGATASSGSASQTLGSQAVSSISLTAGVAPAPSPMAQVTRGGSGRPQDIVAPSVCAHLQFCNMPTKPACGTALLMFASLRNEWQSIKSLWQIALCTHQVACPERRSVEGWAVRRYTKVPCHHTRLHLSSSWRVQPTGATPRGSTVAPPLPAVHSAVVREVLLPALRAASAPVATSPIATQAVHDAVDAFARLEGARGGAAASFVAQVMAAAAAAPAAGAGEVSTLRQLASNLGKAVLQGVYNHQPTALRQRQRHQCCSTASQDQG